MALALLRMNGCRAFKLDGSVSVETKNVMAEYKFRGIDMEAAMLLDDEMVITAGPGRESAFYS